MREVPLLRIGYFDDREIGVLVGITISMFCFIVRVGICKPWRVDQIEGGAPWYRIALFDWYDRPRYSLLFGMVRLVVVWRRL